MASKVAIEVEIKNIKKVADLKKEIQGLRKEQKEAEKQAKTGQFTSKKSEKQYISTAKAIKNKSKNLRDLNKNLSGSTKATKAATKSSNGMAKQFIKGAAAIGIVVGAFRMVTRALSGVISTFTEFEFVMAKVNAVSGATESEFKELSDSAQELGRTTFFTATQVGELQLAFSKLGFTAKEIQDAQQATLDLATATGTDLARAAQVAGAAVRGFGLDANETQRVVDVMAVSFASSAMDIEKWSTSMTKVAPIAKSAGFSIEDTAAIMSKLTDSGIEASIAGTSLRNILLKMQDPTSDLTKSFGRTIHGLDDLVPAMKKFVEEGGSMADVMEVVDLRQAAAFEQMLTTADGTVALRNALLDANGEGERMALIVGDTLQGAFLKLKSATEGLSIAIVEQFAGGLQGAVEKMATFFNKATENAKIIVKWTSRLIDLVKFLGLYKTIQVAATAATVAFSIATGTASASTLALIGRVRALTATMMANPYVAVGALLIALATDMFDLRHQVDETDKSWEKMNQTIKGDISAYETRQKIIGALKSELVSIQDVQRAKIAMIRIDEEIVAGSESREAAEAQAIKNSNELFRESDYLQKETYIAQTMRDFDSNIQLKDRQRGELKLAIAIGEKNLKLKESTFLTKEDNDANLDSNFIADVTRDAYIALMNSVVDGTMKMKDAEQELFDFRVDLLDNLLLDESLSYDERTKLEEQLVNLKLKNQKEERKENKKTIKSNKDLIKEYSDLGGALTTIAGDSDKLNGVRKAGEAITKAAAVAESLLTIKKALGLVTEKSLTAAKLLGIKAQTVENVQTGVGVGLKTAESGANLISAGSKNIDTASTIGNTIATTLSLIPKAIGTILSSASAIPFPLNIIAIIATMKLIKKVMKFEEGGVVGEGNKYANGGMVHGASHANGGVKFAVGGRVNELEGGEAVINKRSTAMFRNQLSSMNQAGGGVKFADGGLMSSPSFTESSFAASNQSQMMGAMQGQRKVVVVESDITTSQSTVSVIQSNASF